jgi:hypothetical protein
MVVVGVIESFSTYDTNTASSFDSCRLGYSKARDTELRLYKTQGTKKEDAVFFTHDWTIAHDLTFIVMQSSHYVQLLPFPANQVSLIDQPRTFSAVETIPGQFSLEMMRRRHLPSRPVLSGST